MTSEVDLSSMNKQELVALKSKVEEAIALYDDAQLAKAVEEVKAVAEKYGLEPKALCVNVIGRNQTAKKPRPIKFMNPDDPQQTWSGFGRQPKWYSAALEAGKSEADLKVAAPAKQVKSA